MRIKCAFILAIFILSRPGGHFKYFAFNLKQITGFSLRSLIFLSMFYSSICMAKGAEFQKGMCYVAWEKDQYSTVASDKSLELLANTGATHVSIITTYYQNAYNSKFIFANEKTPTDKSIIHAIDKAHKLGLKVMLKPHLDLIDRADGLWRGDIGFQNPDDWQEWFSSYLKFILHYAKLAEKAHAEIFSIGTELSFASKQTSFWQDQIIPMIRQVYSGRLIYSANWDEYKNINFWPGLDYVGVDAYFPLAQEKIPGYNEIKTGWLKWADALQDWHRTVKKPIIFTEIGYSSCESSAAKPWENFYGKKLNLQVQADCYNAAMSVLSGRSWCSGLYWWHWRPSPKAGGLNNRDFTPQNKPAEMVLSYWYNALSFRQLSH